jgi:hypothetical protein
MVGTAIYWLFLMFVFLISTCFLFKVGVFCFRSWNVLQVGRHPENEYLSVAKYNRKPFRRGFLQRKDAVRPEIKEDEVLGVDRPYCSLAGRSGCSFVLCVFAGSALAFVGWFAVVRCRLQMALLCVWVL